MANIKWKERFAQVYEDSGVKDKYNEFKGYMSNVAEKLNMPSFDEVRGKVSTYADSFTDKVKEGYVNAKTGFNNLKGDFADDGKLNYSNMDLESDGVVDSNVTYNVVGAGNSPVSQGHKTWDEANAWRQANLPSGNIVEQQKEAESQKVSGKDSKESSFFDSFKDKVNSVSEQFKSRFALDEKQSTNERGNESFFSDIFDKFKSNESEVQNDDM